MESGKVRLGIIGCGGMAKSHESGAGELTQRMDQHFEQIMENEGET